MAEHGSQAPSDVYSLLKLNRSLSVRILLKRTPGTENIFTRIRPIQTVPEFYSRPKSDVVKRATEYETKYSLKKHFLNMLFEQDFR